MSISIPCPGCGAKLKAREELVGMRVKCPSCGTALVVNAVPEVSRRETTLMSDELVTPENLSKALLKSIFDAALMDNTYDEEGDLVVSSEQVKNCWVIPGDHKDRILLLAIFRFKSGVSRMQQLECANKINTEYAIVRAHVGNNDTLRFTYYITVNGGVTRKAVAMAVKRFCSIPHSAIAECGPDLVA
jgi:DNA-directed RNA polymerase subunit RPC12/RpoP